MHRDTQLGCQFQVFNLEQTVSERDIEFYSVKYENIRYIFILKGQTVYYWNDEWLLHWYNLQRLGVTEW